MPAIPHIWALLKIWIISSLSPTNQIARLPSPRALTDSPGSRAFLFPLKPWTFDPNSGSLWVCRDSYTGMCFPHAGGSTLLTEQAHRQACLNWAKRKPLHKGVKGREGFRARWAMGQKQSCPGMRAARGYSCMAMEWRLCLEILYRLLNLCIT
jgi:hypothetical protein